MAAKLAERRLSRQAEPDPELESIVAAVREADERLRMTMSLLHDEEGSAVPIGPSSLADAVRAGQTLLQEHGFRAEISIQGDLGRLSAEQSTLLGAAAGEAFANLVKHGDPARPCAVVVAVTRQQAELTLLNHPRTGESPTSSDDSFGLLAMRRRMTEAGGTASAEKVGEQWRVRIQLPLG
jgi:signal transduction histidine kinase